MSLVKTCSTCGESKPLSQFTRDRSKPDGHRAQCKACRNASKRRHATRKSKSVESRGYHLSRYDYWVCLFDPTHMYTNGRFDKMAFAGTLYDGNWPTGSIFRGYVGNDKRASKWRITGYTAQEINGHRILIPKDGSNPTLEIGS